MEEILIDDANDKSVIEKTTPAVLAKSCASAAAGSATDSSSPRVMSMLYLHQGKLQTSQPNNNTAPLVNLESSLNHTLDSINQVKLLFYISKTDFLPLPLGRIHGGV